MKESTSILLCLFAMIAVMLAVIMPTPYDKEPEARLGDEVRAEVMMKLCFPNGIYTQSANKYCQKFKSDLMEHMTLREQMVAEKCLKDNVNINKCVRIK